MKKKMIVLALCTVMAFSFTACGGNKKETAPTTIAEETETSSGAEIANPFVDCQTLEEAAAQAGFDLSVPDSIGDYSEKVIQTAKEDGLDLIQVFYTGSGEEKVLVRKGICEGDISGDYTVYEKEETVTEEGIEITLKGDSECMHLALWTEGEYKFSLYAEAGMDSAEMVEIVKMIK